MIVLQVERNVKQFAPDASLDFTLDDIGELNPDPVSDASPIEIVENTRRLLATLHAGSDHYFLQFIKGKKRQTKWFKAGEPFAIPAHWPKDANIYFGVSGTSIRVTDSDRAKYAGKPDHYIEPCVASKNKTLQAVNAAYIDADGKDFTDPTPEAIAGAFATLRANPEKAQSTDKALWNEALGAAKLAEYLNDRPKYDAMCAAHVAQLKPAPSHVINTGGGLQCYWVFDQPFLITCDADFQKIKNFQAGWVKMMGGDPGAKDPRRILRLPGTHNFKKHNAPNYPLVHFVKADFELRYSFDALNALLPAPETTQATTKATRRTGEATQGDSSPAVPYEGDSPIFAYNAKHKIVDVLLAQGYTWSGDRLSRPGNPESAGVIIDLENNRSQHWGGGDPLCDEHWRRPFDVFKEYEYGGNLKRAVAAAAAELGMVKPPVVTDKQYIQAAREWSQSANFAEWIPVSFHGSRGYGTLNADKFLYSAFLDTFAGKGYAKMRGPVSNQQLSLASGLSSGSVRRALQRLLAAGLIRKIDAPEGADSNGAFWYELVLHEAIVSCARGAALDEVNAKLPRATYATETFTTHKADDPYQRSGTKRQRAVATVKNPGPGGLLLIDALNDYGPMAHQQIGAITKQSKFTISRLVRHLEVLEVVTVEKKWRERVVTLAPDWEATIKRLTPKMPTFGNKFRRTLNAHLNTIDNCDRQVARGMGDREKIEARRERAAKAAFELQAQELAEHFATDRQREALARLHQHDSQSRAAAGLRKNVRTLPFVEQMARKEAPKWFAPYSQEDNRRLAEMMQMLQDNEDLAYARQQMRDEDAGIYMPPTQATYAQVAVIL